MTGWTQGYVTEIGYIHGYHVELNPLLMRQALLSQAVEHRWPRKPRYLELGFGQGLSLNIHAAATEGEFWGCDFNPIQVANAQELVAASGANLRILDASFEELAARSDLPTFDVIALHGIWSWISDANRRAIVEIARRHLAVGGVFYVSYNTTPGWAAAMPLRHLMTLHADLVSGEALGMEHKISASLDFAQSLVDGNAAYFRVNPAVAERLKTIKGQARNYLAHEYFNADWHPMAFSDMARYLSEAKLSFAATTHLMDHVDAINLRADQQKLLHAQSHTVLRESVRDYLVNQQFRRDLWIRGPRPMAPPVRNELARSQAFALATAPEIIPLKATTVAGEFALQEAVYRPVIGALADDAFAPKTLVELCALLPALDVRNLTEALTILTGMGHVLPTQAQEAVTAARPVCDRLNAHLVEQAIHSGDVGYLASPVAGGGIAVSRFHQLFLRALKGGRQAPAEWAQDVWKTLLDQGQRLAHEGRALVSAEENLAELTRQASEFEATQLPILRALQVA